VLKSARARQLPRLGARLATANLTLDQHCRLLLDLALLVLLPR
jgi:hypothetical protein